MEFNPYPAPNIAETDCPNLQAALAMETGATTTYDIGNQSRNSENIDPTQHSRILAGTYEAAKTGLVVVTATRLALQALCEACPGLDTDGNCSRQLQADKIFAAMPASYAARNVNVEVRTPPAAAQTPSGWEIRPITK